MPTPFPTVCVVGLGTTGAALAARIAATGRRVIGVAADPADLGRARGEVRRVLDRLTADGDLAPDAAVRIDYTTGDTLYPVADLVIEALPERLADKVALFRSLDRVCPADTVFVTTTTGLSVTEIASRSGRMTRLAGLHTGNPGEVAAARAVEIVPTPVTDHAVRRDVTALVRSMGLTGVPVTDQPGFLGGSLSLAYLNSAAAMCEQGYASAGDIDTAMMLGCGMPIGPLAQLDAIGLDVVVDSLAVLAERTGDRGYRPAPILSRMVAAGLLGRKTGRGFHRYDGAGDPVPAGEPAGTVAADPRPVTRIGVVGGGTMGAGIAEMCARAGFPTTVVARTPLRAKEALAAVEGSLERGVRKGKLTGADMAAATGLLSVAAESSALADCDLVVEAVTEDLIVKREVFAELDRVTRPGTILATTTSSLLVLRCATATSRPEDVIGMHFFNPVPVMRLVEVSRTMFTSDEVAATALALVSSLGKRAVSCGDRTGFIVNALLVPYLNRAVTMLARRHVTPEQIDTVMAGGHGFPMGPFDLIDVIGLDVLLAVQERLYDAFAEPELEPAEYLSDLVASGILGRKTGRGFRVHASR
jgi:3-hydroxybutyryl-CoA dehydrogenase